MLREFKTFIARGNVIDLAIGIIIGAAFTSVVKSLVDDVIMPPLGYLIGGIDFSDFFVTLSAGSYATLAEARAAGAATLNYGVFVNAVLAFVIVSFVVFIVMREVNRFFRAKSEDKPAPRPRTEELLEEIRDLLKERG